MKKMMLIIILIGGYLNLSSQAEKIENLEFYRFLMNTKISLKFEADSFVYHLNSKICTGGYREEVIKGTYDQLHNRVRFSPSYAKVKSSDGSVRLETDQEKIDQLNGVYEILKLDSVLLLLKLADYFVETAPAMISDNGYMKLISRINKDGKVGFRDLWSTCDREEHFALDASLKNYLPEKWKDYIMDAPIETKIIDSLFIAPEERPGKHYAIPYIVTLDKGKVDGLKTGLRLFCEDAIIRIFEVSEKESKAYLHCMPSRQKYYLSPDKSFSTAKRKPRPTQ